MIDLLKTSGTIHLSKKAVLILAFASFLSGGLELTQTQSANARRLEWPAQISQGIPTQELRHRGLSGSISQAVLRDASRRSGIPVGRLRIVQATPRTFSNLCQFNFGEVCTYEYRPIRGWEIVVRGGNQSWTYHVDRTGSRIAIDPNSGGSTVNLPIPARNAVLRDASRRAGLPVNAVQITRVTPRTFGNPCEFNFGKICTKEYNPVEGWEVMVQVGGESWRYHVSRSNYQVVLDPGLGGSSANLPYAVEQVVLQDASRRSGLPVSYLQITQATPKTFGNPCIFNFGEICTREYRPIEGWEVVVQVRRQSWIYHVDRTGSRIALDPNLGFATGGARFFRWRNYSGSHCG